MENLEVTQFDEASFFEEDKESLITKEQKGETNPDLYRVSLELSTVKNKTYDARGRFVRDPRWKDANNRYMGKYHKKMYYLTDPTDTSKKFYAECPSNWGIPTSQNIISSAFFRLRESDSATLKRIANNNFGQIQFWWSLFKIDVDAQQPELVDKVKILRFGKPVNTIIQAAVDGKPELGKAGLDVYNAFRGKDFFLNVFEKSVEDKDKGGNATKKFPSYERSSFDDEITSILIDGERVQNTDAGRKKVIEYLTKNAPELQQMEYKKWNEEMEQKVIDSMRITIGDDDLMNSIIADARKGVRKSRVSVSKETQEKIDKENPQANTKAGGQSWEAPPANNTGNVSVNATTTVQDEASLSDTNGLPEIETEEFNGLE